MRRPLALAAASLAAGPLALGFGLVPAHGADSVVVISGFHYLPGDTTTPAPVPAVTVSRGAGLTAENADGAAIAHTITADAVNASGAPLFTSGVAGATPVAVSGVSSLAPGSYAFHCAFHASMHGVLQVTAS